MERVALVGGARTPFVRAFGVLSGFSNIELGAIAVKAAIERSGVAPDKIDELVFGSVLVDPRAPNLAREVIFKAGLPKGLVGHAVSNNCISGLVAISMIADGIRSGRITCGVAGGTESMSRPALAISHKAESFWLGLSKARTTTEKLKMLASFRPRFAMPIPPSPKEPSTGLTMGQHCELMAKEFKISRAVQDEIALRSHQTGAKAQSEGFLAKDIVKTGAVDADNLVRADTTAEKLARLKPVFDRSEAGTITAGNASALTDGASAVVLMSESRARREGREILGFVGEMEFAAIDPNAGLLMAPALAVPRLLARAQKRVADFDLFEIHEAFGAQVACNLKAWESGWGGVAPIGAIPQDRMNVNGGSIALGHPFAATGGRLLMAAARGLKQRSGNRCLISICAAGAMAGALIVEKA